MEPPILYLKDIHLNFGGTPLLEGAEISVQPRDRICLVGRNGSGKSTLLKIAAGMIEPDRGERFIQPGITLRYLPQEPDTGGHDTIASYVNSGLAPGDDPHRAAYLIEELGLDPHGPVASLSGGEFRRAALARTLAPEPDILLLDEPTNHLDLPAIEWLETALKAIRSAIVMISHDRRFLETLSRRTVWMDRGVSRSLEKGFSAFEDWREQVLEEEEQASHKLARKIVREEHWIVHGVSGRRKRNMRRVRELAELKRARAAETRPVGSVNLGGGEAELSGKLVAELKDVTKSYGGRPVVSSLSAIIRRGDRIGIAGPNGAGKTTLVRLITGSIQPDQGIVRLGVNLETLVIDQKRDLLKPEWTLKDALTDGAGDSVVVNGEAKHVMSYMKDYLFLPEQARTPVAVLSGGERARLMLARGLRHRSNLLVLDEPTNDLDLETLDLLQEYLAEYQGTVILVSHDRDFLDRVSTAILASDGDGQWTLYAGGYSDMVAQKGAGIAARSAAPASDRRPARTQGAPAPSGEPPATRPQKAKLSFKQKHALETLPGEIAKLEKEIAKLRQELADPGLYARDPARFAKCAGALDEREKALAAREEEWLELEILREAAEA